MPLWPLHTCAYRNMYTHTRCPFCPGVKTPDIHCALSHPPLRSSECHPPVDVEAALTQRTGRLQSGLSSSVRTTPLLTCLMCRRDLKTESFGGCQLPQAERKDDSAGQGGSSRPSAPSGVTAAFSSSSASELSQLSDSSSKSTGQTNRTGMECFPLDATAWFCGHFCLRAPTATPPIPVVSRDWTTMCY